MAYCTIALINDRSQAKIFGDLIIPPLAEWWVYWNTLVRPSLNLVYITSHLSFVEFYSNLVSWLAMISACAYYTDFMDG